MRDSAPHFGGLVDELTLATDAVNTCLRLGMLRFHVNGEKIEPGDLDVCIRDDRILLIGPDGLVTDLDRDSFAALVESAYRELAKRAPSLDHVELRIKQVEGDG
jgi:hypothetical protein